MPQYPRLKILVSAYACEPGKGSEPGVGWNWVSQISKCNDVWVITRSNNRQYIEEALSSSPMPSVHWIFFDLASWALFWKKKRRGIHLYYYIWQLGAYWHARQLHRKVKFDLVHHVTLVIYWMPSCLSLLRAPFVWGPVGGGDSIRFSLWRNLSWRGKLYETLRTVAQWISGSDPFLRFTARRAVLALATTRQTLRKLEALGCRNVQLYSQVALPESEIAQLGSTAMRDDHPFRLISIGMLVHLKGFDFSLKAFAQFSDRLPESEYWIIGEGPERSRLQALARDLGVTRQVTFWGALPRTEVLRKLVECDVMIHPALHDSGGWASLEGMAAGLPVIGLDAGGTALQLTDETGIKVPAFSPEQLVRDLTMAIKRLAKDRDLRLRLGQGAKQRVKNQFNWDEKGRAISELYRQTLGSASPS